MLSNNQKSNYNTNNTDNNQIHFKNIYDNMYDKRSDYFGFKIAKEGDRKTERKLLQNKRNYNNYNNDFKEKIKAFGNKQVIKRNLEKENNTNI